MKNITSFMLIAIATMAFLFPVCVQGHVTLAAGTSHYVQIVNTEVYSWGENNSGQLGQGDFLPKQTPQPVSLSPALNADPLSLCSGNSFVCVLDTANELACTGNNFSGQMGVGTSGNTNVLGIPTGVSSVAHVACGVYSVLATTTSGALRVWGLNKYGLLGLADAEKVWVAVVSLFMLSWGVVML
jgi:alpha-tubulin suppressor-like RCC1 family protein